MGGDFFSIVLNPGQLCTGSTKAWIGGYGEITKGSTYTHPTAKQCNYTVDTSLFATKAYVDQKIDGQLGKAFSYNISKSFSSSSATYGSYDETYDLPVQDWLSDPGMVALTLNGTFYAHIHSTDSNRNYYCYSNTISFDNEKFELYQNQSVTKNISMGKGPHYNLSGNNMVWNGSMYLNITFSNRKFTINFTWGNGSHDARSPMYNCTINLDFGGRIYT